jgi:hypothetical protein
MHRPKDEVGGGSAWFAGFCHYLMHTNDSNDSIVVPLALRRADLLAALCQETVGDHSLVTPSQLAMVESKYANQTAYIAEVASQLGPLAAPSSSSSSSLSSEERVADALDRVRAARVIAIIRAPKNSKAAIERGNIMICISTPRKVVCLAYSLIGIGLELASMGCGVLEITLDTQNWQHVLSTLVKRN